MMNICTSIIMMIGIRSFGFAQAEKLDLRTFEGETMKKPTKYVYYKVIQGNYGYGWDDEDYHETSSDYTLTGANKLRFRENLKAYQENGGGVYRVVNRRELREQN